MDGLQLFGGQVRKVKCGLHGICTHWNTIWVSEARLWEMFGFSVKMRLCTPYACQANRRPREIREPEHR